MKSTPLPIVMRHNGTKSAFLTENGTKTCQNGTPGHRFEKRDCPGENGTVGSSGQWTPCYTVQNHVSISGIQFHIWHTKVQNGNNIFSIVWILKIPKLIHFLESQLYCHFCIYNYFSSCLKTNIYTRITTLWNKRCVLLMIFAKSRNMNKIALVTFRLTRKEYIFCCWTINLVSISGIQCDLKSYKSWNGYQSLKLGN